MSRTLITLLLLVFLAACAPIPSPTQSPLPVPTATLAPIQETASPSPLLTPQSPQAPKEGMGAITGRISARTASWEGQEVTVYACPFTPNKEGTGGFFILEPTVHPRAAVALDGSFQIPDVPPGAYVIVAGPVPEEALAYRKTDQPAVVEVSAGKVLELGDIEVR